jgi:KDO2-lipid IV(A) lauroyltransferase
MSNRRKKSNFFFEHIVPVIFKSLVYTLPYLPLFIIRGGTIVVFWTFYPLTVLAGIRKRFARNIKIAFQDRITQQEANRAARRTIGNWLMTALETVYFYHPRNRARLREMVDMEGMEKLQQVYQEGKGIIAVTAHFGNFPLIILRLNLDMKVTFLLRNFPEKKIADFIINRARFIPIDMILTKSDVDPVAESIRALSDAFLVFFVADEFKKYSGITVEFFGKSTQQAAGPSVISLRTDAPQIPMFIIKQKCGRHKVIIEDPIEYTPTGDMDRDIQALTQKRMEVIEKYIRRYPDMWLWVHSRWGK